MTMLNRFLVRTLECPKPQPAMPASPPAEREQPAMRHSLLWTPPETAAKQPATERHAFVTDWQLA